MRESIGSEGGNGPRRPDRRGNGHPVEDPVRPSGCRGTMARRSAGRHGPLLQGKSIQNAGGNLVLTHPWPGMLRGIYKNPERYKETYWSKFKGIYLAGDVTRKDNDGFFWVQGRADDVLNVSGHRIGNSEVESALVSHPMVAEAAVIGKPHDLKGESITSFVVLKKDAKANDDLRKELRNHVGNEMGKIARPDEIWFVNDVPKTRSGKIMRRVIRSKALGKDVGDTSTLANPEAVEEIGKAK